MNRSVVLLASLVVSIASTVARAGDYQIDPVHTALIYRIKHLQSSFSYGRFDNPSGTFSFDPAAPDKAAFELTVKVADINSGNPKRDDHLKSPDFFNAKEFPTIHFKSTAVKKTDGKLDVTGDLTIHGVTKSVTVPLTYVGTSAMQGKTHTGFEGTVEIKRSEFEMNSMPQAVGDEVRLLISIEGMEK